MTENEWAITLSGDGARMTLDGRNRLRYIVSDAVTEYASEVQKAGRPDQAGLLRYIASELRVGAIPSKKSMRKAAKLMKVVEARVVDGVSASGI